MTIAAPAECPAAMTGLTPTFFRSSPSARAISGIDMRWGGLGRVNPWPGRSGATTVNREASKGSNPRQEWVAAPVP